MNDEIKEILDKLKETVDYPKLNYSSYDKSYNETIDNVAMIKSFACKQLLDYITNLQKENQILKDNNENMQEEMCRTGENTASLINSIHYDELHHYRVMRDIEEILKNKDEGYIETYDKLEEYIKKELEKYE